MIFQGVSISSDGQIATLLNGEERLIAEKDCPGDYFLRNGALFRLGDKPILRLPAQDLDDFQKAIDRRLEAADRHANVFILQFSLCVTGAILWSVLSLTWAFPVAAARSDLDYVARFSTAVIPAAIAVLWFIRSSTRKMGRIRQSLRNKEQAAQVRILSKYHPEVELKDIGKYQLWPEKT